MEGRGEVVGVGWVVSGGGRLAGCCVAALMRRCIGAAAGSGRCGHHSNQKKRREHRSGAVERWRVRDPCQRETGHIATLNSHHNHWQCRRAPLLGRAGRRRCPRSANALKWSWSLCRGWPTRTTSPVSTSTSQLLAVVGGCPFRRERNGRGGDPAPINRAQHLHL